MSTEDAKTCLHRSGLDRLMPLHVQVSSAGEILHSGPTFRKLLPDGSLENRSFFEAFELIRPHSATMVDELSQHSKGPLKLKLRGHPDLSLRGLTVPASTGLIVNMSFGLSVVEAVRRFDLTNDDFAPTDLAIELLYLVEAKSAAYDESRRLNARLSDARHAAEEQASTDMLTGLRNRRALVDALEALRRNNKVFTLMHVDLDYFKDVNDRLGHAAGDHVLQHVADILTEHVRGSDLVARIGGDEFVLLFHRLDDPEGIELLARRLISRLEEPIPFRDTLCRISASIGSTVSTNYVDFNADRMLRDADAALYISKREGRGRATHLTPNAIAAGRIAQVLDGEDAASATAPR